MLCSQSHDEDQGDFNKIQMERDTKNQELESTIDTKH